MDNNFNVKNGNSLYKNIASSVLIGLIVFAVLLPLFALVVTLLDLNISSTGPLASICIGISSAASGFIAAKKNNSKGLLLGSICGFIIFAIVKIIALLINPAGITLITLIHLTIIMLAGCIGGILGVNSNNKRKII